MSILVTGGTGFLGNNAVRLLRERGDSVRALVPENADQRPLDGLGAELMIGDIRDANRVREACNGVDDVVHCAGIVFVGWSRLAETRAVNFEGTKNGAQAARKSGARMIHVSKL